MDVGRRRVAEDDSAGHPASIAPRAGEHEFANSGPVFGIVGPGGKVPEKESVIAAER
ncbi:hypothetical protein GCM10022239_01840 [Leifsonia bigeumensis]|uniref:Uncharacterized protein n=1 Tax=Leifsonella bigeumensis TaxID=433643 RepID=A0ABP7F0E9_9MICO